MKLLHSVEPKLPEKTASFVIRAHINGREVCAMTEVKLGASSVEDDFQNTMRALEQAVYASFYATPPASSGVSSKAGDDHRDSN